MFKKENKNIDYLIVLGAGPQQKVVYDRANKLKIPTVAIDYNPKAVSFCAASKKIIASVKNEKECIESLYKSGLKFSGVMTYGVEVSPIVASIAQEFNLISVSPEVALKTTNKYFRSSCLQKANIPIPNFELLRNKNDLSMNPPFIIKPTDNSGARGVQLVKTIQEFDTAFEEALSFSGDGNVIVEDYLIGDELSIEGFVVNGNVYTNVVTDRNFVRDGSTYPIL